MTVGPIAASELPQAAHLLARAFRDNPALSGLLRCDAAEAREQILRELVLDFCEVTHRYGAIEAVRDGGTIVAVSLSFGPGAHPLPMLGYLGTAWAVLRNRPLSALRFIRFDHATEQKRPVGPHWYLWFLGVEPELQGRGLGSRLVQSLSRRAKSDGDVPCHLETDRISSVRLYQRHGYVLTSSEHVRGADTEIWFMDRAAESAGDSEYPESAGTSPVNS